MTYTVFASGQGIRIDYNGERVGRWNAGDRHLVVYDAPGRETILREYGFAPIARPTGGRWWKLPENELASFRKALECITGERIWFPTSPTD